MSLFRARDLVNFQSNSAFDPRAICPISEEGGLVLGTLQGDINLYTPKRDDQVDQNGLLYTTGLKAPILQIRRLNYLPDMICIAVLTPRRLLGFSVLIEPSNGKHFKAVFEHKLDSDFYSMDCGGFSGFDSSIKSDFIFVLSPSGLLRLFQCDRVVYSVNVPGMIFPSPIVYLPGTDSVIFQRTTGVISCYLQNNLAMSSDEGSTSKSLTSQWEARIPEIVLELVQINSRNIIFVRGPTSAYMLDSNDGTVSRQISFEGCRLTAMHIFENEGNIVQLFGTDENQIFVYNGAKRVWASSSDSDILGLNRMSCDGLAGCILLASRDWRLSLKYFGTRPENRVLFASESRLSAVQIQEELGKLSMVLSKKSSANDVGDIVSDISLNASFAKSHSPRHLDLKLDVNFGKQSGNATISATPAFVGLGKSNLTEFEINEPQTIFGSVELSGRPFLNDEIEFSINLLASGGRTFTVSKSEALPLEAIAEQQSDIESLTPDVSLVLAMETRVVNQMFRLGNEDTVFLNFCFDSKVKVSWRSSNLMLEGDCVGCVLILKNIWRFSGKSKVAPLSSKTKTSLLDKIEKNLSQISNLTRLKSDLNEKMSKQLKFLTAVEKSILVKVKDRKESPKIKSLNLFADQALESLTALRKALSETERNITSQATRAYAFVQILISFLLLENNLHGSTTEKVINIFKIPDKRDELLIQFDEQISTVGSLLGIQHGSSGRQCEVSKIVKKLAGLASRIDSNTVEKLSRNIS